MPDGLSQRHLFSHVGNGVERYQECDPCTCIDGASSNGALNGQAREGMTFGTVLDQLRHELALRYIRTHDLSLNEISSLLGFSHPASFDRAFKRWTALPADFDASTLDRLLGTIERRR